MSTTPRPWEVRSNGEVGTVSHRGAELERFTPIFSGDRYGDIEPLNADDPGLIVTAVNEHDALVAFVVAVRGLDVEAPMIPTAQVRRVLATLDTTAPVEGDER